LGLISFSSTDVDKCSYNDSASVEFIHGRRSGALRHCWKCKPVLAYWRCSYSPILGSSSTMELAGITKIYP